MPARRAVKPGETFDRLTVIRDGEHAADENGHIDYKSIVKCRCGTTFEVRQGSLRSGNTTSCGCKAKERAKAGINWKHHHAYSSTYKIWQGMKKRCYNAAAKNYRLYGSRGIVMAPRWLVFENFLQDMGERPAGFSIERIKNDGNYTPRNCRWASRAEQSRNTRQNRFVTVRGKRLCLNDAARNLGISPSAPYARARYYNISLQEAVDHYVARE